MKLKHLLAVAGFAAVGGSVWAQQIPADGSSYYLYNTETGKFLTRGEEWGTRAVVNNYGQPWKVTVTDGKYKLQMLDMVNAGETAKNLNGNYVDNSTATAYAATGDANGYVLSNADGKWLGVSSGYYANTAGTDADKTWQFLNQSEYETKQADILAAQYQSLIDASLIDATPATLESVLAGATATDVTEAAGLSGVPSKSTWAETQHGKRGGAYNAGDYGLECYETGNAHITKTINGLEQGIYKVKVKAMYRSTSNAACLATGNAGYTNSSAYFAANGYTVQIKDWYSGRTGDAAPNSTTDAKAIMDAGTGYVSEFYTYVGPAGTLSLEAVSESHWGACWLIFSGVELTKYSDYATQSMADDTDLTSWLTNPSFESGNMNGWTDNSASGMWTTMTRSNDTDPKVGVYWMEKYSKSGKIDVSQTLTDMPAGHYRASVLTLDQASKTYLIAESNGVQVKTPIVGGTKAVYTVDIMVDEGEDLKIGLYCDNHNSSSWVGFDDFHLTYVSANLPELPASATGLMNATVAAAQTTAVDTYNSNKTAANYNAAVSAIAAAQASKAAYANGLYFVNQANSALGTTFTTSDPVDVAAVQTKYNAGEYADNVITNRVTLIGERTTGIIPTYMLGGWSDGLYINTWSTEGDSDGSNFKTPFYEYWIADANALADKTITGTLTGLENGLYSVTADVRVRAKNEVAVAEATGINLVAGNGTYAGTEGNGTVDATEGTQIGESQMAKSTVTAYALVKDGILTANFVVEDANISWLAFQNVTYAKVRDLTPEEEAVVPTAIALNHTEAALDAANNTTTLEVTYTPNDATEGIVWTTSDANVATVADGVVTGVAPGTATITATSTLDANVQATCVVTVTYEEAAVPAEYVVKDNAGSKTIYTLASTNLVKNGAFEYADHFYGHNGGDGKKLSSPNWTLNNNEGDYYVTSTASAGAGDAKSYSTHWAIESGKKYIFGYSVKHNTGTTAMDYFKVSLDKDGDYQEDKVISEKFDIPTTWTDVRYIVDNTAGTYQFVQLRGRWLGAGYDLDNFFLAEITNETTTGDLEWLAEQMPTVNAGTGVFQFNTTDAETLIAAGTATVQEVKDAAEAMTVLNAPAAGDKFHVAITYSGYRYSGHALESNGTSGVAVPLADNTANNNYPNDWTFAPVAGTKNGYTMSITTANGTYYVCTGAQDNGSNDQQIRMTTDPTKALTIVISPAKSQEGVYYLNNSRSSNASIGCQDDNASKNGGWYTTGSHNTHTITPATKATANLSVTAAKYGTFIAPFDAEIPSGVTLYTCESVNGDELVMTEADAIEANKAYIAYSESVVNETLEDWGLAIAGTYTSGLLTGVYTKTDVPEGSYILLNQNDKVAFYVVDAHANYTTVPSVAANRAYLTAPAAGARVRALNLNGNATAIEAISAIANNAIEAIYNANGVKVNALQKGINVVKMQNGKTQKVLVK